MSGEMFGPYKAHPIANKWDMLEGAEFASMVDSIRNTGQAIPVVVWGDWLLDGRNRWRACEALGIAPRIERREFSDYKSAGKWIVAVNRDRRHDSPTKRAKLAADPDIMDLYRAEAKDRQGERTDLRPKADIRANLPESDPEEKRARTQAAQAFGVSPRSVQSAIAVQTRGTPELNAAVDRDEVAISAAEQIAKLPPDEQREVVAAGPEVVREVAAEIRKQPANFTSLSDLWFTPAAVIEAARELLGGFDLDPASCAEANEVVGAAKFYTQEDDGLSKPWHGRVWCNPPYGRDDADNKSNQAKWTAYMADQYDAGNFEAGCLLVTFVPDRQWFERMWQYPMCAFRNRLRFRTPGGGIPASPTSANVVVYFGEDVDAFRRVFSRFGAIVVHLDTAERLGWQRNAGGAA